MAGTVGVGQGMGEHNVCVKVCLWSSTVKCQRMSSLSQCVVVGLGKSPSQRMGDNGEGQCV